MKGLTAMPDLTAMRGPRVRMVIRGPTVSQGQRAQMASRDQLVEQPDQPG